MTLFFAGESIDLSDQALLAQAEAEQQEATLPAGGEEDAELEQSITLPAEPLPAEDPWQAAAAEADRLWPELAARKTELFNKMGEISTRYGDAQLWKLYPQGILRQAALELLGPPRAHTEQAVQAAVKAARAAALAEAEARQQSKAGLAPGSLGRGGAPALSEQEKLVRAMSMARGKVF